MSLTLTRLVATFCIAVCGLLVTGLTVTATSSDNTWAPTGALLETLESPVFALAADPADGRHLLAGTASGAIYLSVDAGTTWRQVRKSSGRAVLALAFDPGRPGTILAGTRGAGVWRSVDAGLNWQSGLGGEARTVRAFAFLNGAALAASDEGILSSRDGVAWSIAGLSQVRISALAVLPTTNTSPNGTVIAGGDATHGAEPLPLFSSPDVGQTW